MPSGYGLPLVVVALAVVAVLLVLPDEAGAQSGYCPESGIVPDSAFVVSSTNQAGAVAGHKVWFQLCQPLGVEAGADGDASRLSRITLIWQDAGYYPGQGFFLNNREAAGITLRELGGNRSWNATAEPYGGNCCVGANNRSVAVDFNQDIFSTDTPAGKASPLTLQFEIPMEAEMINPLEQGRYRWEIMTVYNSGGFCSIHDEEFSSPILEIASGNLELRPGSGGPGSTVEISGTGFKPLSPVQSIRFGELDLTSYYEATTDDRGNFALEITAPGLDDGMQPILVQVGGVTVGSFFTITNAGYLYLSPVEKGFESLGDNLVIVFHFYPEACQWSFYDPKIPEDSDLILLIPGETYWLSVKEPQEVILNRDTRNLTCTPDGNCWNVIVW